MTKRPDMRPVFRAQIARHVRGMLAPPVPQLPRGVARVTGDVTSRVIIVTMSDGTEWQWEGGRYGARRVALCYPPLMPIAR